MNDKEKELARNAKIAEQNLRNLKGCQACKNAEVKFIDEQLVYICKIKNENVMDKCGFMCLSWK